MNKPEIKDYSLFLEQLKKCGDHRYPEADFEVDRFLGLLKYNHPFAYARFNDGECSVMAGNTGKIARGDQNYSSGLQEALINSLMYKQENYFVGVPCQNCYPIFNQIVRKTLKGKHYDKHLVSAVALTNRNWRKFVCEFPKVIEDRTIIWVGGKDQNIIPLLDIGISVLPFMSDDTPYQNKNTWDLYSTIKTDLTDYIETVGVEELKEINSTFCISLGPVSRILVCELFKLYPDLTFLDMGSMFDPFTRNVWHKCHLGWETGFNIQNRCKICN